jgi:hypothetical protein
MVFIQKYRDLLSGVKFNTSKEPQNVDNLWRIKIAEK